MQCWINARDGEKKQFYAISLILSQRQFLLDFLFNPHKPELSKSADQLLYAAQGFCSQDYLLIKLCLDIWCDHGKIKVHELFNLEPEVFKLVLKAFEILVS